MSVAPALPGDTIYQGAAHVIISKPSTKADWVYLWAEGDLTVSLVRKEHDLNVAGFGPAAHALADEVVEVVFTPASHMTSAVLAYLYGGILAAMPGASWYGATSTPIWIHTMAGRIMAIANARPTSFPGLNLGMADKRFDGSVTLTGVLSRGTARTTANALFTPWADESFLASPLESDFAVQPCSAAWAAISANNIEGMDSWKLTPRIKLTPRAPVNLGTIDYTVDEVVLEASCTPANLTEANLWASYVIGSSRALGSTVVGSDLTLTEDTPGLVAVVKNARLIQPKHTFDTTKPIAGQCTWRSHRSQVTGVWTPAGTLAMAT